MRLYSGTVSEFVEDSAHNRVAEKLKDAFTAHFRSVPSPSEVNSWRNSLRAISQVAERAELKDNGVMLEYQLPTTSRRLDCLFTGRDLRRAANAVIVEFKQWEVAAESEGDRVLTFLGGAKRDVLHPSAQVGGYCQYLNDCHTAFSTETDAIALTACSYLHNYTLQNHDSLLAPKFSQLLEDYPLYSANDSEKLITDLNRRLGAGEGTEILDRIERSKYRPSKKLLEHVSKVVDGRPEYILLDEQVIAFDQVIAAARRAKNSKTKTIVLVIGGPGTGKSVIALNLMAQLARDGFTSHYATGSNAFTETLREIVGKRASALIKYFNSYTELERDALDVIICDEAHRLRKTSSNQYTPAAKRTGKAQIDEIVDVARTSVFFIDDRQLVRPAEIGSTALIRETALKQGATITEVTLQAQFRCAGSDGFIQWVNNTLEIDRTPTVIWNLSEPFEFKIFDTPVALDEAIRGKLEEGSKARITAGFCWPWSDPVAGGQLANDVILPGFERPWNAKPNAGRLAQGIPKSSLWAYKAGGENQVGCIYTAQGFEFDYVGVIFGKDLVYQPGLGWVGQNQYSHDSVVKRSGTHFTELVKNTYRVLLTRGMKGCYVHFADKDTENFFRSRTERHSTT
jgi:DUF2075 family protein